MVHTTHFALYTVVYGVDCSVLTSIRCQQLIQGCVSHTAISAIYLSPLFQSFFPGLYSSHLFKSCILAIYFQACVPAIFPRPVFKPFISMPVFQICIYLLQFTYNSNLKMALPEKFTRKIQKFTQALLEILLTFRMSGGLVPRC